MALAKLKSSHADERTQMANESAAIKRARASHGTQHTITERLTRMARLCERLGTRIDEEMTDDGADPRSK